MRHRAAILTAAALLALAPAAIAQRAKGQGQALSAAQVKAGLFGVDMTGYSPTYGITWRECIDPQGRTLYHTPAGVQRGRLKVTDDGKACFAYEDTDYQLESCFRVERNGAGFIFNGDGNGIFVTTKLVPRVKACRSDDLVS